MTLYISSSTPRGHCVITQDTLTHCCVKSWPQAFRRPCHSAAVSVTRLKLEWVLVSGAFPAFLSCGRNCKGGKTVDFCFLLPYRNQDVDIILITCYWPTFWHGEVSTARENVAGDIDHHHPAYTHTHTRDAVTSLVKYLLVTTQCTVCSH